jgi:hypothetical protein
MAESTSLLSIEKAYARIKATLCKPQACTTTAAVGHPRPMLEGCAEEWMNPGREQGPRKQDSKGIGRALQVKWKEKWEASPRSAAEAVPQPPSGKVLERLAPGTAQSRKLQLQTRKIGLRDFCIISASQR